MAPGRARLRSAASRWFEAPAARLLARAGLGPNAATLLGLALSGLAGGLVAYGAPLHGGIALLAGGALDMVDGALARATGRATRAGALLDSVADRVGEAAVLLGVLLLALGRDDRAMAVAAYAALAASVMVSYIRARAEGLGVQGTVGLLTRPERIVLLSAGLLSGLITLAVAAVAALSLLTAAHRFLHAWSELRRGNGPRG